MCKKKMYPKKPIIMSNCPTHTVLRINTLNNNDEHISHCVFSLISQRDVTVRPVVSLA